MNHPESIKNEWEDRAAISFENAASWALAEIAVQLCRLANAFNTSVTTKQDDK